MCIVFYSSSSRQCSGLSEWIEGNLHILSALSPASVAFLVTCLVAVATQVMVNVASTTLFLPIVAKLVRSDLHVVIHKFMQTVYTIVYHIRNILVTYLHTYTYNIHMYVHIDPHFSLSHAPTNTYIQYINPIALSCVL